MNRFPTLASVTERRVMTEEESLFLVMATLAEHTVTSDPNKKELVSGTIDECIEALGEEMANNDAGKIFLGRLKAAGTVLTYSPIFISYLMTLASNIAGIVMWAYFLVEETRKAGRTLTITDFGDFFPMGIPTEEAVHAYWDSQKVTASDDQATLFGWPTDNRLDLIETWREETTDA